MVLFAQHDLLKDSPFSRLDLVSCRNLLIYLNREAQKRVFEIFHFALLPGGRLFLGSSETAEDAGALFAVLDKKHRIFAPRPAPRVAAAGADRAAARWRWRSTRSSRLPGAPGGARRTRSIRRRRTGRACEADARARRVLGRAALQAARALAPPSMLVDAEHDILHLSPSAGRLPAVRRRRAEPQPAARRSTRACASNCARRCTRRPRPSATAEVEVGAGGTRRQEQRGRRSASRRRARSAPTCSW